MQFGAAAEVLAPVRLRSVLGAQFRQAAKQYEPDPALV
jgi:hypothetical protein